MKSFLLSFLLILTCANTIVQGQDRPNKDIIIDGVIISKEDGKPVPFVHVININTKQGVASNMQGRFTLQMKPKDSLVFSATLLLAF